MILDLNRINPCTSRPFADVGNGRPHSALWYH